MRRFLAVIFLAAACAPRGGVPTPRPDALGPPSIILISIDGFRADYLDRHVMPVLDSLAAAGVRARWMEPSFPSKTFPNHYTIVTGLRPDHHGIVANNIHDAQLGSFSMSNRAAVQDARWWGGEPIWVTAAKAGRTTSAMFWPGSEAPIEGIHATHWMPFDNAVSLAARVDSTLHWMDVPASERPAILTLYASPVDNAGHHIGPASPAISDSMRAVDAMLRRLVDGLHARHLGQAVNIIIVSDHGMAPTGPDRVIALDDYISLDDVVVNDWGPVTMLAPKPGKEQLVYNALKGANPAFDVYWSREVPARFAFGTNPRIGSIVGIAAEGWTVTSRAGIDRVMPGGNHGFDNALPSMRAIFIASGPAFRRGAVVAPFANIHVYDLMAHILGLTPAPNDGSLDSVRTVLAR
ncbi:MAG: ectonucleotide pyrophosphatase/phosphodiesterase [Gemmatimonadota bacterium]